MMKSSIKPLQVKTDYIMISQSGIGSYLALRGGDLTYVAEASHYVTRYVLRTVGPNHLEPELCFPSL